MPTRGTALPLENPTLETLRKVGRAGPSLWAEAPVVFLVKARTSAPGVATRFSLSSAVDIAFDALQDC